MTPTNQIEGLPPSSEIDVNLALRNVHAGRAPSVAAQQHEHHIAHLAKHIKPKGLKEIEADIVKHAAAQEKLNEKRRDLEASVAEWEGLCKERADLKHQIARGHDQVREIRALLEGYKAYASGGEAWGTQFAHAFGVGSVIVGIRNLYSAIHGCERAIQGHTEWTSAKEAELAGIEKRMREFAKKHDIESHLPPSMLANN